MEEHELDRIEAALKALIDAAYKYAVSPTRSDANIIKISIEEGQAVIDNVIDRYRER